MSGAAITIQCDVDLDLDEVAQNVSEDQCEAEMLEALAFQCEGVVTSSGDADEKALYTEAAAKLTELAKWFRENVS